MAAPLLRTNTAPVYPHSADGVARLQNMSVGSTPRASQLSGSTAFTSTTSLTSLSSAATIVSPPANGQVVATSNIINQKADASRSLYQMCVALKQRLGQVPGFEGYLDQLARWEQEDTEDGGPVESVWSLLRTGHPLLMIYNTLEPEQRLEVDQTSASEEKRAKLAIFKFVQACLKHLNIPSTEMFVINDLTGNDTTGFVKVLGVVNLVLDQAEEKGKLRTIQPYPEDDTPAPAGKQMSYRDHIVRELVDTERKYVQDLENLYDLKKALDQRGVIPGDIVHQIFLNINAILDFQRRFLIRVETTNSMPSQRQEWGGPFVAYEDAFSIYQPFIANQRKAAQIAGQVFDKIQSVQHPVACDFNTLDGFLLKPMQRLDLLKKSDDEAIKVDLAQGISSAERCLQKANEAVDRDLLDEALDELVHRVDDWKNHRVEQFGRLLLHGVYTVVTGKSDQEKDYEIYLFECILLCCKEVAQNKSKDKKDKTRSTGPKVRNKNAKLQLKGRIFMTNVTEVLSFAKPGSYTVQIWWKGDPGVENFVIRFQNEEMMRKWAAGLDAQRKENAPQVTTSPDRPPPTFAWMQNQMGDMANPYAQQDEDDDDDYTPPTSSGYGAPPPQPIVGTMTRNASSTSLRQRSATGESTQSLAGIARAPPPRYPLPQPPGPLSVQTQMTAPAQPSPGPRGGDSYFSPIGESPVSSRTSTASSMFPGSAGYPFPKTGTPQPGWGEDNNSASLPDLPIPTQLKVKVNCDSGNYVTLVVAFNITYQSLIDRIDAKLARFTASSIGKGNLRLRYRDEDGDFVSIESDDDIQIAFLEWREGVRNMYSGGVGEIELFCVGETS
ncbi:putative rho guanine nucleotide exchange factor scd1 protein [Phaeoacremonium minimum UCRPA7]|uniref:Putative rho guanine nucleotide exchange factor scd1 protein n=1 Tax=Phaeoacremonium minimum (strain UCR-PA7) TaxID=1286976 RepID=R8BQT3_PHAM7|nr:putative rho guanine nucleotide exchange factor scd1 protein [Phaeoacremonium minimum UCRPA7]EOO01738.1 putative rho guanine nucleotide exchange factor scd1 protein [Phaeoacremonium minimum UCRPA7]